jgi:HAD superfamily hydrolase (TIGR01509 family)
MHDVKCIIFDCDGVLVDSEGLSNKVLHQMTSALGFSIPYEEICKQNTGRHLKECFSWIETQSLTSLPIGFEQAYRQKTFEIFAEELQPVDGIKEFVSNLSIPFCVASSGPIEKIKHNLGITGLLNHFENRIFSSYQIKSWKPNPEIFLHAAEQMGFSVPDCVVIEDSLTGVRAAVAGGFKVYALNNDEHSIKLQEAGAITINHINDLSVLLNLK